MGDAYLRIGSTDPVLGPSPILAGTRVGPRRPRGEATATDPRPVSRLRRALATFESLAMAGAGVGAVTALLVVYERSIAEERVFPGVMVLGEEVGGNDGGSLAEVAASAAARSLDRDLVLGVGELRHHVTARALGAVPSPEAAVERALAYGRASDLVTNLRERSLARRGEVDLAVGMRFDEERALSQLRSLAPDVDTISLPTRLDLDAREVLPARRGRSLLPYDSLSTVAVGLAAGHREIELVTRAKPPVADPLGAVAGQLDVSVAIGTFSTPYSQDPKYADRTHNLKVGAAAIDGTVLMPGERFSFNELVGPRVPEAGYRYAPAITSGQLVDELGGGICQIASSLHGAAFFSGMDIVSTRPHSRPSGYVDMGLDATVVYPTVDLVLRNDFDFPVVLHMSVQQGKVLAEILGPRRPFQVAFERQLESVEPFKTSVRYDPRLRAGHQAIAQQGMRGFTVKKTRTIYRGAEVIKQEDWSLTYPPTTEILRLGTSAAGEVPPADSRPRLRDPVATLRLVQ